MTLRDDMNIIMITPAPPQSRVGNRTTAIRWARILRDLGNRVTVSVTYDGRPYDLMIALHAWRSAEAIVAFHKYHISRPLIVALTGTDLYRFIHSHPEPTLRSIQLADHLVALHELAHKAIPGWARSKIHIIYQSAKPLPRQLPPTKTHFDICVVGHLREEKDSLRAAYAVRNLPTTSKIRVLHYGKPHNEEWERLAQEEMRYNTRYHWYGEVPHWKVRQAYGRCRLLVLSSRMEGGANVISEAVVAKLPVIASDIDGTVGLLGATYPGYYPTGDTDALRELLLRAEADEDFVNSLTQCCTSRIPLFTPRREAESWVRLLKTLG